MKLDEVRELLDLLEKASPDVDMRISIIQKDSCIDHHLLQQLGDKNFFVVLESSPWNELEFVISQKR